MIDDTQRRKDLADFLRTRRMRLSPEQVGLFGGGRRRTPGLRREEVAQLANVGVSWYTLLEQGRDINPSREVLHSIATALQLSHDEQQHLFLLSNQQPPSTEPPPDDSVSPTLRRVLDALNPNPAYVVDRRWLYQAWNTAAEQALLLAHPVPPYSQNAIWRVFADQRMRESNGEHWEKVALKVLEEFRADTALYSHEAWFKQLLADLHEVSPEFRAWWPNHNVRGKADSRKEIEHPLVGRMVFEHTTLLVANHPELKLMVYTPIPGTGTLEKLHELVGTGVAEALT